MRESSKAMRRRYIEDSLGHFQWMKLFRGDGIDVGCGNSKIPFDRCIPFDKEQGDANNLLDHFSPNHFSYLHSSQCLEHTNDPTAALKSWIAIVKPRGHIIVTVPDFTLYEHLQWPSHFNPDHKSTWSMSLRGSPAPIHCFLPQWLEQFDNTKIVLCRTVDAHYDFSLLNKLNIDQTLPEDAGVEAFIEFILQRK